jgi:Holliday junction resolvasome RuvABC endonuclease subunit
MILSLDPGSSKIGYAITNENGTVVRTGVLSPIEDVSKSAPFNLRMNALIRRLIVIFQDLIEEYKVTHVAWEIVPSFGAMANRDLVQATAITLKVITFQKKLEYQHFTPQSWHKELLGNAKVTKDEVKSWVKDNVHIIMVAEGKSSYDMYDAIAIGQLAHSKGEWNTNEFL